MSHSYRQPSPALPCLAQHYLARPGQAQPSPAQPCHQNSITFRTALCLNEPFLQTAQPCPALFGPTLPSQARPGPTQPSPTLPCPAHFDIFLIWQAYYSGQGKMSAVCKNGSLRHSAVLKVILFWLIKTQCSSEGYTVLMTGQGWAGLGRAGQGWAGQGRAGLGWAGPGLAR